MWSCHFARQSGKWRPDPMSDQWNLTPNVASGDLTPWHNRRSMPGEPSEKPTAPHAVEVNEELTASPGIEMLPVAGLISARGFLCSLGSGVFLSTQYIRHHSMPLYTPEPDVVHELVGHATSFFRPEIVRLTRLFG